MQVFRLSGFVCLQNNNNNYYYYYYYSSTSDLQPSTPTVNQLPGQLISTEIRTMYKYKF